MKYGLYILLFKNNFLLTAFETLREHGEQVWTLLYTIYNKSQHKKHFTRFKTYINTFFTKIIEAWAEVKVAKAFELTIDSQ